MYHLWSLRLRKWGLVIVNNRHGEMWVELWAGRRVCNITLRHGVRLPRLPLVRLRTDRHARRTELMVVHSTTYVH